MPSMFCMSSWLRLWGHCRTSAEVIMAIGAHHEQVSCTDSDDAVPAAGGIYDSIWVPYEGLWGCQSNAILQAEK